MKHPLIQLVYVISLSCVFVPASAAVIHKWVDDDGITHYSNEAPTKLETEVTKIEVPEPNLATVGANDHYYSIANQWQRLHQESLEREKLRIDRAKQKAVRQPAVTNVYINESSEKRYVSTYPRFNNRKLRHHRYKPRHFSKPNPLQGNYPVGLHPSRNRYVGSYQQLK